MKREAQGASQNELPFNEADRVLDVHGECGLVVNCALRDTGWAVLVQWEDGSISWESSDSLDRV